MNKYPYLIFYEPSPKSLPEPIDLNLPDPNYDILSTSNKAVAKRFHLDFIPKIADM